MASAFTGCGAMHPERLQTADLPSDAMLTRRDWRSGAGQAMQCPLSQQEQSSEGAPVAEAVRPAPARAASAAASATG